ncbi:MAG: ATP-binding cassette domain-containing protein [Oscillospiraceae bacterium]|nr:ATP-binding cassette domain-containing protein [Oscillospiraceae bacterium]
MVEVKNVTKQFEKKINKKEKQKFLANEDITFSAKEGEILGVLGPNGAGKTTLLRVIAGTMNPTKGSVTINGLDHKKDSIKIRRQIAFLTGSTKLYKDISPYELLKMCGEYYEISEDDIEKRIKEISKRLDMEAFLHQRIETLSVGQTQRTGIARCLIHSPKYYIMDEATSGLDIISSQDILEFIKEEKATGKCILYSTHYMEEAENICDRVVFIHKGKVLDIGTPDEIKKNTGTTNLRDAFLKSMGRGDE